MPRGQHGLRRLNGTLPPIWMSAVLLLTTEGRALAAEAGIEFQIHCPVLESTAEGVGELEARALIELSVRRGDRGTVQVSCDAERATLRWLSQGKQVSATVAADSNPKRLVDTLIAALWRLRTPTEPEHGGPAPAVEPQPARPAPSLALAVSVGWHAELRTRSPNVLPGARLNIALLAPGWSVSVLGEVAYALDDVADSRARTLSAGSAFDLRPRTLRPLTIGVGLLLGRFSASAPNGFDPGEQTPPR